MSDPRYGIHKGVVVDNNDPSNTGRVVVQVPSVFGDARSNWCEPTLPTVYTPRIGEVVWVQFVDGDLSKPIYASADAVTAEKIVAGSITAESLDFTPADGEAVEQAQADATQALLDAYNAAQAAGQAATAAGDAQTDATQALLDAFNASQAAGDAQEDATQALADALAASTAAATADAKAVGAQEDADLAVTNAAEAKDIADGKSVTHFADDEPTGKTAEDVGDLWFDTNDGYKMYRWDGDSWEPAPDARISQALSDAQAASTAAGNAQTTANTKITTSYQDNEPVATTVGDLWVDTNDQMHLHRWDGSAWISVRDATIAAAASAASAAQTAAAAADSKAVAAQATADGAIRTYYQESEPWLSSADPALVGDMWSKTSTAVAYRWDGSSWVVIPDTAISEALAAAADAQTTADGKINAYYADNQPWANGDPDHAGDAGDLWYDTNDDNKAYYYSGTTWTALPVGKNALDPLLKARDLGAITTYTGTSPGAGPFIDGDLWIDTTVVTDAGGKVVAQNVVKRRQGTNWVPLQDQAVVRAIADAVSAANTADAKMKIHYANGGASHVGPAGLNDTTDLGDLWFETDNTNKPYQWKGSGAGGWVPFQFGAPAISANARQLGGITTYTGTSPGAGPFYDGDLWIDTTAVTDGSGKVIAQNVVKRREGTNWVALQDQAVVRAITDATNAANVADGKMSIYYADGPTGPTLTKDTPPRAFNNTTDLGDLWFDTSGSPPANKPYQWKGTGLGWVAFQFGAPAISATARQLGAISTYQGTSPGAGPFVDGDIWIDTNPVYDGGGKLVAQNIVKMRQGTNWVALQDQAIARAIADATGAANTADGKMRIFYDTQHASGLKPSSGPAMAAADVGDLWFNASDNYRAYRWDGTSWTFFQFGSNAIAQDAIKNTHIDNDSIETPQLKADAITSKHTITGALIRTNDPWVVDPVNGRSNRLEITNNDEILQYSGLANEVTPGSIKAESWGGNRGSVSYEAPTFKVGALGAGLYLISGDDTGGISSEARVVAQDMNVVAENFVVYRRSTGNQQLYFQGSTGTFKLYTGAKLAAGDSGSFSIDSASNGSVGTGTFRDSIRTDIAAQVATAGTTQTNVDARVSAVAPTVTMTTGSVGTQSFRNSIRTDIASEVATAGTTMRTNVDARADARVAAVIPPGTIQMFASDNIPAGWLLCDGRSNVVLRTSPLGQALYNSSSGNYIYGNGDGATTCHLPDFQTRFPIGSGQWAATGGTDGKSKVSRTPEHTHGSSTMSAGTTGSSHTHNGQGTLQTTALNWTGAVNTQITGSNNRVSQIEGSTSGSKQLAVTGDTGTTGSSHTHNITGSTDASAYGSVPFIGVNFIIKT